MINNKKIISAGGITNIIGGAICLLSLVFSIKIVGVNGNFGDYVFPIFFILYGILVFFPKYQNKKQILTFGILEAIIITLLLLLKSTYSATLPEDTFIGAFLMGLVRGTYDLINYACGINIFAAILLYLSCAIWIIAAVLNDKKQSND